MASETAWDRLGFALVHFTGSNGKNIFSFSFFLSQSTIERNKVPESLSELQLDPDSRARARCPPRASFAVPAAPERGAGSAPAGRARGPAAQPGLQPASPPDPPGTEPQLRGWRGGRGSGRRGSPGKQPRLGVNVVVNLGWERCFILMILTRIPSSLSLTVAFPRQPLGFRAGAN